LEEKQGTLSAEEIKAKAINLLKAKAITFVSFDDGVFKVEIKDEDEVINVSSKIEDGKLTTLEIEKETLYKKVYQVVAKTFINKYLEKEAVKKIEYTDESYLNEFISILSSSSQYQNKIAYDKIGSYLLPRFHFEGEAAIKVLTQIYLYLKTHKKTFEVANVEFIMLFMAKLGLAKDVVIKIATLMGESVLDKGYVYGNSYALKAIFRGSPYCFDIIDELIKIAKERPNSDINVLFNESLDSLLLSEDQLIDILNMKGVSSFYLSKSCIYAIDNNFEKAIECFTNSNVLTVLESSCQEALAVYLIKTNKSLARKVLRLSLESRPRYSAYKLYKSILTEEEIEQEKPFFSAVAQNGGFIGAYRLENNMPLTDAELADLTPEQAINLAGSLNITQANEFGDLVKRRIEKLLSRKSLPNEISDWLIILFYYSKQNYNELSKNPRIQKEVINLPSFRRFFLLALEKENLLEDNGLYRYSK